MSRASSKRRRSGGGGGGGGRKKQSSSSLAPWLIGGAFAVVAVGLFVSLVSRGGLSNIEGLQTFGSPSRGHTAAPVSYAQTPPVGGDHSATWQNCGIYDTPVPNELGVHSMEHGAVWITYQPDLPAATVEQLRNLARGRGYTLLSPYEGLPQPIFASAWGVQISATDASDPRLNQFISRYIQGPQTPEPGAVCTGGLGSPIAR
jgi:Protein of unknown function (DUF3105)